MTDATKLLFSKEELEMVTDVTWVLTKREILQKVANFLNHQIQVISQLFTGGIATMDAAIFASRPKISKGENYRLLPYLILDYPSVFSKKDVFALRTMFWWGNFVSVTLHVSGSYKELYQEKIIEWLKGENDSSLLVCVSEEQWEHHFEPHNYVPATQVSKEEMGAVFMPKDFLKVAYKFQLQDWDQMHSLLSKAYANIVRNIIG